MMNDLGILYINYRVLLQLMLVFLLELGVFWLVFWVVFWVVFWEGELIQQEEIFYMMDHSGIFYIYFRVPLSLVLQGEEVLL